MTEKQKCVAELEAMLERCRAAVLQAAPEHLRELGPILRKSAATDSLVNLRHFFREHDIKIPRRHLPAFRDYLIIHRIDLQDIEPAARERLRARTLSREDSRMMSVDYQKRVAEGEIPRCRDCRWFVTAPGDDEENSDKSCTELGTKGIDVACYGFTLVP